MAMELLVIFPIVVFMMVLIVGLGRYSHGRQIVTAAAASAARAATLAGTPEQADTEAGQMATATITQGGLTCRPSRVSVDLQAFVPGGQVSVTVECAAPLSSLAMIGLPRVAHLTATSTSPLDTYRSYSAGAEGQR